MPRMGELKTRVLAKKKALEAQIMDIKADAQGTRERAMKATKGQLKSLENCFEGRWDKIENQWEEVTVGVKDKLNDWLKVNS